MFTNCFRLTPLHMSSKTEPLYSNPKRGQGGKVWPRRLSHSVSLIQSSLKSTEVFPLILRLWGRPQACKEVEMQSLLGNMSTCLEYMLLSSDNTRQRPKLPLLLKAHSCFFRGWTKQHLPVPCFAQGKICIFIYKICIFIYI